jgi:hypothetical protein
LQVGLLYCFYNLKFYNNSLFQLWFKWFHIHAEKKIGVLDLSIIWVLIGISDSCKHVKKEIHPTSFFLSFFLCPPHIGFCFLLELYSSNCGSKSLHTTLVVTQKCTTLCL